MSEETLLTATAVVRELEIPVSTLYRLVSQGVIPTHPIPRKPWHRREVKGFYLSEVRAALGLPPAAPPGPGAG
jgi:antitoxin component of RelBE/YafQ-DinJ toxin-antitoxin module